MSRFEDIEVSKFYPRPHLVKLDGRYRGHENFRWMIDCGANRMGFLKIREWCVDAWGLSEELELWNHLWYTNEGEYRSLANPHWAWFFDGNYPVKSKIYIRDDDELAWYKLKWT